MPDDTTIKRLEIMLQELSEAVDQNRREVNAAVKRCEDLSGQLDKTLNRIDTVVDRLTEAPALAEWRNFIKPERKP